MEVVLSPREMFMVKCLAKWRMHDSHGANLTPYAGAVRTLKLDVDGAIGELVVAKALNLWPRFSVDTFKEPDLYLPNGAGIQVRMTQYTTGRLLVRRNDADGDVFVQVVGRNPYTLTGWCYGWEARNTLGDWKRPDPDRPACWIVEQGRLHPVHELMALRAVGVER